MSLAPITLQYMKRVLVVGHGTEALSEELVAAGADVKRVGAVNSGLASAANRQDSFDCVVVRGLPRRNDFAEILGVLDSFGAVYIVAESGCAADDIGPSLKAAGLRPYIEWACGGGPKIVMAVRAEYDPVGHARLLFKAGHPEMSLEVLVNVPDGFFTDPRDLAKVAAEKQLCYLAWDRVCTPDDRLNRFFWGQREFYRAVTLDPYSPLPYVWHSEFWRRIGDDGMAARILRSIERVNPSKAVREQLETLHPQPMPIEEDAVPEWTGTLKPRILIVCHENSDYGLDTLYDGLVRLLGPDNVVEFPWKPCLHGRTPEMANAYPCTFDHAGEPHDIEWVCARLREEFFDLVFYADTLLQLDEKMVREVFATTGKTPVFVLDTWDDGGNYLEAILGHIGRTSVRAYFKREMLQCAQYPADTYPLLFGYPEGRVPADLSGPRTAPMFWAGKRQDGLRRLYLEHIESTFGFKLDASYTQEEYARALDRSKIGINLFGLGFDTVRYWELPAHGCMLFTERPPIRIPYNFRDGTSAVFFDDIADLDEKLAHYIEHPDEARAIAEAGHRHFMKYHTGTARARQLLGRIERLLDVV